MRKSKVLVFKITLSIISLALCVLLTEVGLRLSGKLLIAKRNRSNHIPIVPLSTERGEQLRILTLGDSITFGGWGAADSSYPAILQDKLQQYKKNRFHVTNNGMCGNTTHSIVESFTSYVKIHDPDYIFLIIGAANRYRFGDYYFKGGYAEPGFLDQFATVKMVKYLYKEIELRYLSSTLNNRTYGKVEDMWIQYSNKEKSYLEAEKKRLMSLANYEKNISTLIKLGHIEAGLKNVEAARHYYKSAYKLDPHSNDVRTNYSFFMSAEANKYIEEKNLPKAIGKLLEAITILPNNIYINNIFRPLSVIFKSQSVVTTDDVLRVLDEKLDKEPEFKYNSDFMGNYLFYKNMKKFDREIDDWVDHDLTLIAKACKQMGIKLVLMSYPVEYHAANRISKNVAERFKIPFIDITSEFKNKIKGNIDLYRKYIKDDDHCTGKGHELIANAVFNFLAEEIK